MLPVYCKITGQRVEEWIKIYPPNCPKIITKKIN